MEATTEPTAEVIGMDAPNTVPVNRSNDLKNELAATVKAWLGKKAEKSRVNKKLNEEVKELEDRITELVEEVEAGGTQLSMFFASTEVTRDEEYGEPICAELDADADDEEQEPEL